MAGTITHRLTIDLLACGFNSTVGWKPSSQTLKAHFNIIFNCQKQVILVYCSQFNLTLERSTCQGHKTPGPSRIIILLFKYTLTTSQVGKYRKFITRIFIASVVCDLTAQNILGFRVLNCISMFSSLLHKIIFQKAVIVLSVQNYL